MGKNGLGQSRHDRVRRPGRGSCIGIGTGNDSLGTAITQGGVTVHVASSIGIAQRMTSMVRRHIIPAACDLVRALAVHGVTDVASPYNFLFRSAKMNKTPLPVRSRLLIMQTCMPRQAGYESG